MSSVDVIAFSRQQRETKKNLLLLSGQSFYALQFGRNYPLKRWMNALLIGVTAEIDMARHALYGVSLAFVSHKIPLYNLLLPGLRDGSPSITIGQTVLLRQLILDKRTNLPQGMDMWLRPGGGSSQGMPAPGFTGVEIQATVYAIDRTREILVLTTQALVHQFPLTCNVGFTVSPKSMVGMHRAVDLVDKEMLVGSDGWICRMLFPKEDSGFLRTKLPPATFDIPWYDSRLNHEQKVRLYQDSLFRLTIEQKAVHATLKRDYGELPFLIYGPPGSGKTKTVCELVLQLAGDAEFKGSVLLCAPSNPAADTLANRLSTGLNPTNMLRLNDSSRTFAEIPNSLLPYCFVKDDMFSLPPPAEVLKKKVVVCTCRDADILVQARLTNRDIARLQRDVTKMTYPFHESPNTLPCHWLALIIDEAAQSYGAGDSSPQ